MGFDVECMRVSSRSSTRVLGRWKGVLWAGKGGVVSLADSAGGGGWGSEGDIDEDVEAGAGDGGGVGR